MMRFWATALLLGMMTLVNCSSGPSDVAGGTVIPNLIVGSVVYNDTRPAIGKQVTLQRIVVTPNGDSIVFSATATTDQTGRYAFQNIAKGKCVISCIDTTLGYLSIIPRFEKRTDSTVIPENMVLRPPVVLRGRVLYDTYSIKNNLAVSIPGAGRKSAPDTGGFYTLSNVPRGQYEIAYTFGNTVSFLPLSVETSARDTVYLKDIELELQGNNRFNTYCFYDNTFDYFFSILPVGYRSGNEPAWYAGKDFSQAKYYAIVNNSYIQYNPKYTMLFIIGSDGSWLSDENLISRLEKELSFSVFPKGHNAVSIADTAGMDVIYLSASIIADTLQRYAQLHSVHQPIVSSEENYYPYLMMTDSVENTDFGDYSFDGFIKIVKPSHFIASGFTNYVQVLFDAGYLSWGKPAPTAEIIAVHPNREHMAAFFTYEKNTPMINGFRAPARRVGNFFSKTNYTVRNLTDDGWKMFCASLLWAMGKELDINK